MNVSEIAMWTFLEFGDNTRIRKYPSRNKFFKNYTFSSYKNWPQGWGERGIEEKEGFLKLFHMISRVSSQNNLLLLSSKAKKIYLFESIYMNSSNSVMGTEEAGHPSKPLDQKPESTLFQLSPLEGSLKETTLAAPLSQYPFGYGQFSSSFCLLISILELKNNYKEERELSDLRNLVGVFMDIISGILSRIVKNNPSLEDSILIFMGVYITIIAHQYTSRSPHKTNKPKTKRPGVKQKTEIFVYSLYM
ncbi:hypothetical protein ACFE04_029097 [Oxalis oulophora]